MTIPDFLSKNIMDRTMRFGDWVSLRYHLFWGYENRVLRSARSGIFTDEATSCWLVRKGEVILETAGHKSVAKAGQWAFVASPIRRQDFSSNAEILSLHFDLTWPDGGQVIERDQTLILDAENHPELEKAARPIVRHVKKAFPHAGAYLQTQPSSLFTFLRVQSLLPIWIVAYLKVLARLGIFPSRMEIADDRLLLAAVILDKHRFLERFSESALAKRVGLNRSRFDALFVSAFGMTPRRYLERRRMRAAKDLLQHDALSVKEVALSLGFRHASHFSIWFQRLVGNSPSEFRRSCGKIVERK